MIIAFFVALGSTIAACGKLEMSPMDFDWKAIGTESVVLFVGAASSWIFSNIVKLRRDMDAAFKKLRYLEEGDRDDAG